MGCGAVYGDGGVTGGAVGIGSVGEAGSGVDHVGAVGSWTPPSPVPGSVLSVMRRPSSRAPAVPVGPTAHEASGCASLGGSGSLSRWAAGSVGAPSKGAVDLGVVPGVPCRVRIGG